MAGDEGSLEQDIEHSNARRKLLMNRVRRFAGRTGGESGERITALIMNRFSTSRLVSQNQGEQAQVGTTDHQNDSAAAEPCERKEEAVEENTAQQQMVLSSDDDYVKRELGQSVQVWVHNANALVHSREMSSLINSSRDVALDMTGLAIHGAGAALHVACLPVTFPLRVIGSATDLIVGTCSHVVSSSFSLLHNVLLHPDATTETTNDDDKAVSGAPIDGLIHNVTNVVPILLQVADNIKNEIEGLLLGFVSPLLGGEQQIYQPSSSSEQSLAGESSSEQGSFLDRLRLGDEQQQQFAASDITKFLMRVDDLHLSTKSGQALAYIDLCPDFQDKQLTMHAIEALAADGLALLSFGMTMTGDHHKGVQATNNKFEGAIDWKAEGATKKLLKHKVNMPQSWSTAMERELLVWSGNFTRNAAGSCFGNPDAPLFLSRGFVPGSPIDIFNLLWDNRRTTEYNKYCLGRSDALVIEETEKADDEPSKDGDGQSIKHTKIIKVLKGETRVPFTSLSVAISTLMYGSKIDDGDDSAETYLIVRRSLTSGGAGYHTKDCRHRVERGGQNNEITWGVNLLRSVPEKPGTTDMITLSQVSSSMVPRFLTHRVGLTAGESFFNALRSREVFPEQC